MRNFSKFGAFVLVTLATIFDAGSAILEKDKGKVDWHIETIGELADLVFLEDNMVYTLSTDGIITYFNTEQKQIKWKKTLPTGSQDEEFHLRHLGRNLLVHSDKRALLINSQGHVIFEQPFEGAKGKVPIEIF
jgi:hypothetical protein